MTDDATSQVGADDAGQDAQQQGQAPDDAADASQQGQADATNDTSQEDTAARLERVEKALKATRQEAAAYRTKAKQLEDKDKTESERLQAQVAEADQARKAAEAQVQDLRDTAVLQSELAKSGIQLSLQRAIRLIDRSMLERDDDGTPTAKSVAGAIDSLRKSEPQLFGQPRGRVSVDGGAVQNNRVPSVDVASIVEGVKQRTGIQG